MQEAQDETPKEGKEEERRSREEGEGRSVTETTSATRSNTSGSHSSARDGPARRATKPARRAPARRPPARRAPARAAPRPARTKSCKHCGHTCCRRRSREVAQDRSKPSRRWDGKSKFAKGAQATGSVRVQAGSPCVALSPLCVRAVGGDSAAYPPHPQHVQITPEMIVEALRFLTKWRQDVPVFEILTYIKYHYPVQPQLEPLLEELNEKLRVAAIAGIVKSASPDAWSLSGSLLRSRLTGTHVTLFWEAYGDTMQPVTKKAPTTEIKQERSERETNTNNINVTFDENIL